MAALADVAERLDLGFVAAKAVDPGTVPVPAVVHWKCGHYVAVLRAEGDGYWADDPDFGGERWVSRAALRAETSGWMLVSRSSLGQADSPLLAAAGEAALVFGGGETEYYEDEGTADDDEWESDCPCCDDPGMATWRIHSLTVNISVRDVPLTYQPPVGPRVEFRATHNHREFGDLGAPASNLGPK